MIKNTQISNTTLKVMYANYKPYIVPLIVLASCIILFFTVTLSLLSQFQSAVSDTQLQLQKQKTVKANTAVLSNLDESQLTNNLQLVTSALPSDQSYLGVVEGLTAAASNAGVTLGDYSFQVSSGQATIVAPAIQLAVNVTGSLDSIEKFINALKTQLPLADITSVKATDNTADLNVVFYYRDLPSVNFDATTQLQPLSSQDTDLINKLSSSFTNAIGNPNATASTSASSPTPTPTLSLNPTLPASSSAQ